MAPGLGWGYQRRGVPVDKLHPHGMLQGPGQDTVDDHDRLGGEPSHEICLEGLDVSGAEPCDVQVPEARDDLPFDDAAVTLDGGLTPVGDDALGHPTFEPVP